MAIILMATITAGHKVITAISTGTMVTTVLVNIAMVTLPFMA